MEASRTKTRRCFLERTLLYSCKTFFKITLVCYSCGLWGPAEKTRFYLRLNITKSKQCTAAYCSEGKRTYAFKAFAFCTLLCCCKTCIKSSLGYSSSDAEIIGLSEIRATSYRNKIVWTCFNNRSIIASSCIISRLIFPRLGHRNSLIYFMSLFWDINPKSRNMGQVRIHKIGWYTILCYCCVELALSGCTHRTVEKR